MEKKWYEYYCQHCKNLLAVEGLFKGGTVGWYARIRLDDEGYITQGDTEHGDYDSTHYECGDCGSKIDIEEEDATIILRGYKYLETASGLKDIEEVIGNYNMIKVKPRQKAVVISDTGEIPF